MDADKCCCILVTTVERNAEKNIVEFPMHRKDIFLPTSPVPYLRINYIIQNFKFKGGELQNLSYGGWIAWVQYTEKDMHTYVHLIMPLALFVVLV